MSNYKTGGAAFPLESDYGSQSGMTLRDYFAGQVIGKILGDQKYIFDSDSHDFSASMAYRVADAMIAERKKGGE
jgi:hypothetical protein